MKPILKLIIAIMLILCLADMPYGFYELVRFAAAGTFVYLSYDYFNKSIYNRLLLNILYVINQKYGLNL